MSTTLSDLVEKDKSSSCCGAAMYELGHSYMCCDCQEWCNAVDDEEDSDKGREFSAQQQDLINKAEAKCAAAGCDDDGHKCE